jgi:predicted branched-subunit amino acid permease
VQGLRAGAPFLLAIVPFGAVFGVVATEAGLNLAQTMAFSVLVIAGAAQLTAIQLMTDNAPTVIVLAAALAVNLRMAMYSASLAPHLGAAPLWKRGFVAYLMVDQAYALAFTRFESQPAQPVAVKLGYYFGAVSTVAPAWYAATLAGALLGEVIPAELPITLMVPVTFLALVGPLLRTLAHLAAAFTSVVAALALGFLPYSLGVLAAAVLAMIAGAEVERRMSGTGGT